MLRSIHTSTLPIFRPLAREAPFSFSYVCRGHPPISLSGASRRASACSARRLSTQVTQQRPYAFHIGVSWAGKPPDPRTARLRRPLAENSAIGQWRDEMLSRPRSLSVKDAGEDFFYVTPMRNNSGISFGVADGVGGWTDSGVDPSLFAQSLMYHAYRYSRLAWAGEPEIDPTQEYEERESIEGWEMTPRECLEAAYHGVLREKLVRAGSSTACLININSLSGLLRAANLGDSGFAIIRSSSVIYRQQSQTHFFNCPFQLTKFPNDTKRYNQSYIDYPSAADTYETKLRDGDIVICYTDGLSDNVFPADMSAICSLVGRSEGSDEEQVQMMADRIVQYAQTCMHDRKKVSPFEREAAREGLSYRGGKMDDVTVIVALVRET